MPIDAAALAIIRSTPDVLRALLRPLPPGLLVQPNDEGWSLQDLVAHLHDVEGVAFVERITRMIDESRPFIRSIDPPARLVAGGYAVRRLDELLNELAAARADHAPWLEALVSAQLERVGIHDVVGEIKVIDIAHQWAAHDMAHLRQAALMIQTHLAPLMGTTREFYDV